jgi:hypothetical protein
MGTDLQDVFDSFFVKIPSVDFTGKESQVVQFLKSAISKCYRQVYDDLTYSYDDVSKEGTFNNIVTQPSIELISTYMVREYFSQKFAIVSGRKQYIGTQAFNKLPSLKEEYETVKQSLDYWTNEVDRFKVEFPDYSDER